MANGNNDKNMGLYCGFSFQVKPWKTQGRFFFLFFAQQGTQTPYSMQNLNKLIYVNLLWSTERSKIRHSKVLTHTFKDDVSILIIALRNS